MSMDLTDQTLFIFIFMIADVFVIVAVCNFLSYLTHSLPAI
jgi:hypothetical protein